MAPTHYEFCSDLFHVLEVHELGGTEALFDYEIHKIFEIGP